MWTEEKFKLPEVRVATWGGWVFINMDDEPQPLEEYMGIILPSTSRPGSTNSATSAHVEKVIGANWKAVLEAFIESYHAIATHPQLMPFQGIDNSQYDVWGDHVSRTITSYGVANPSHADQFSRAGHHGCHDGSWPAVEEVPEVAPGGTRRPVRHSRR